MFDFDSLIGLDETSARKILAEKLEFLQGEMI